MKKGACPTLLTCLCSGLSLFLCDATLAATVEYHDRVAYSNATIYINHTKRAAIDFDDFFDIARPLGSSITISNITFGGDLWSARGDIVNDGFVLGNFYPSEEPMTLTFREPVLGFGANWGSASGQQFSTFTATLTLSSGQTLTFAAPTNPETEFYGFITDVPIFSLTFSDGGRLFGEGRFVHAEMIKDIYMVYQVPEPGGLAFGALSAAACWFRRRSSAAEV